MHYYYNESKKSFAVTTNFVYDPIPEGFVEITEEQYNELQEEFKEKEFVENEENN